MKVTITHISEDATIYRVEAEHTRERSAHKTYLQAIANRFEVSDMMMTDVELCLGLIIEKAGNVDSVTVGDSAEMSELER